MAQSEALKLTSVDKRYGDKMALELDYVPMPDSMVKQITSQWGSTIKDSSGKALWAAR